MMKSMFDKSSNSLAIGHSKQVRNIERTKLTNEGTGTRSKIGEC